MSTRRFSQQIEAAQVRMTSLVEQAAQGRYLSDPIIDVLFHDLSRHLEELTVIDEELREQSQMILTARANMDLEHQRYRDLFEFAPYAYIVTDQSGIIREANQAATELLWAPVSDLLGKSLGRFIATSDRANYLDLLQKLRVSLGLG